MRVVIEQIGSFRATDDEGKEHRLLIYSARKVIDQPGCKFITMKDGRLVVRIKKGAYLIGQTGDPLTSDDPAAL